MLAAVLLAHAAVKTVIFSGTFQIHVAFPIEWATGWALTGVSIAGGLSWLVVVGLAIRWMGGLRLRHLGLSRDAALEALPVLLWVWIVLQAAQAVIGSVWGVAGIVPPLGDLSVAVGRRLQEVLGAGLLEEVVYRGFLLIQLFGLLRQRFGRDRALLWAVAASSMYFGVNHIPAALASGLSSAEVAGYVLQCTLVGVLLAGLFLRTGNLFLAAGGHALLNDPIPFFQSPVDPALATLVGLCVLVLMWPVLSSRYAEVFAVGHVEGRPAV